MRLYLASLHSKISYPRHSAPNLDFLKYEDYLDTHPKWNEFLFPIKLEFNSSILVSYYAATPKKQLKVEIKKRAIKRTRILN